MTNRQKERSELRATEVEINIPAFPGFYESELSSEIDRHIEQLFDYDASYCPEIPDDFWQEVDYKKTHENVAKLWLEQYLWWLENKHDLKISMRWSEMISPREYNFTTDRIFAFVHLNDMAKAFRVAGTEAVKEAAKARFTSYDGFASFYNPNIRSWGKLSTWDANQLGTILAALEPDRHYDLMCDFNCNGEMDEAVVLTEKGNKMANEYYEEHRKLEEWNELCRTN
jgi:hypothetical protein